MNVFIVRVIVNNIDEVDEILHNSKNDNLLDRRKEKLNRHIFRANILSNSNSNEISHFALIFHVSNHTKAKRQ